MFGGFQTHEIAIAYFEKNLVTARSVIARLTGKPAVETPQLPTKAGATGAGAVVTLEGRLGKDQDDLSAALEEIDRLITAEGGGGKPAAKSPAAAVAEPSALPAAAPVVVKPPAPPTREQQIEAAYAKARLESDPVKRSYLIAAANRLVKSPS